MTKNELEALAISLLARDDLAELINDSRKIAAETDEDYWVSVAAARIFTEYRQAGNVISDNDAFDLCEMLINSLSEGESAND